MGITKFVLKRPVTAILAILCLIVFGYQSITGMDLELSPDMDMSMMIVVTQYSGASPEDVSELITKPIEDSVSRQDGLKAKPLALLQTLFTPILCDFSSLHIITIQDSLNLIRIDIWKHRRAQ